MMLPCIEKHIDSTLYQSLSLAFAVAIASVLLLSLNMYTEPAIAQRLNEDKLAAIDLVMPQQLYQNPMLASEQVFTVQHQQYTLYTALNQDSDVSGYVVQTQASGYAGPIDLLIGVDADLAILGVRILSHSETPGLGDKIEVDKSSWVLNFAGKSLTNTQPSAWKVKKDGGEFDQFTGATITPRAVVNTVHQSLLDLKLQTQHATQQGG
ncbi:electron transport complex subunit RsxG [Agarivorans sp. MS3-6]|uniref:electron transport complex subunit RsxG n=1 Tax=Agarivorans sp. TSD2052 TaxID=2937286 RepID=UPI00200D4935|nr:electron transport complex subunit RsxG [Agarivorans sp. TSD2052]UPW20360.1 electron transport complex subunit RsxG [Agarivorans sp. TSD2052]